MDLTSVRQNTVGVQAQLVSSLAKANFQKTFDLFFPLCESKITFELENGASSVPTSSATMPASSDTTLHACESAILRDGGRSELTAAPRRADLAILSGMLAYVDESVGAPPLLLALSADHS